jgi:hypothetical protein
MRTLVRIREKKKTLKYWTEAADNVSGEGKQ